MKLCTQRSCRTSSLYGTGTRHRAQRTPLQRQWRWTRWHHRFARPKETRARGRRALASRRTTQQTTRPGKTCYVCGKLGHYARDSWNRQGSSEGKQDGKASARGRAKGESGGKGNGKVNNVHEEQYDGDQHADSAAVSAVKTRWPRDHGAGTWGPVGRTWAKRRASTCVQSRCERPVDRRWRGMDAVTSICRYRQLQTQRKWRLM